MLERVRMPAEAAAGIPTSSAAASGSRRSAGARAAARLIVADEPVSALDVSISPRC
jgi:ABC-type glutathione transport system ATPase component